MIDASDWRWPIYVWQATGRAPSFEAWLMWRFTQARKKAVEGEQVELEAVETCGPTDTVGYVQ